MCRLFPIYPCLCRSIPFHVDEWWNRLLYMWTVRCTEMASKMLARYKTAVTHANLNPRPITYPQGGAKNTAVHHVHFYSVDRQCFLHTARYLVMKKKHGLPRIWSQSYSRAVLVIRVKDIGIRGIRPGVPCIAQDQRPVVPEFLVLGLLRKGISFHKSAMY